MSDVDCPECGRSPHSLGCGYESVRLALRRDVALMRELGILQWRGIVLAPAPPHVPTGPEPKEHPMTEEEEKRALAQARRDYYGTLLNSDTINDEALEFLP